MAGATGRMMNTNTACKHTHTHIPFYQGMRVFVCDKANAIASVSAEQLHFLIYLIFISFLFYLLGTLACSTLMKLSKVIYIYARVQLILMIFICCNAISVNIKALLLSLLFSLFLILLLLLLYM